MARDPTCGAIPFLFSFSISATRCVALARRRTSSQTSESPHPSTENMGTKQETDPSLGNHGAKLVRKASRSPELPKNSDLFGKATERLTSPDTEESPDSHHPSGRRPGRLHMPWREGDISPSVRGRSRPRPALLE